MKKLIQVSAFLGLMFFGAVFTANAQTARQYSVNIPFEFNVGQKSYPAGDYHIRVVRISTDAVALSIADAEKNKLQTVIIPKQGDASKDDTKLVFNRYKNRRFLSRLMTKDTGFTMVKTAAEKKAIDSNPEIISVKSE